ncbi:3-octaprenyl-4-hydroxybenzoate carboxy-lyase [Pyrolobus fumarii 1A]|uniref:3-octaprenyl-4-hydroxybenzoate carboxy-lyase n=1 Tax=Pyrolobus fumarii (strain DSM 11204 / 1A) TaxID=694429 RepID=G0EC90_PYRF1|nr:UbiX family flavin prenyltransferase [Pyrolobus fumarii]AEM39460.1 3-octaprenyl-4-hydroxybenzoate carboxy-lyase [Pyrolobus fumarii 1A]
MLRGRVKLYAVYTKAAEQVARYEEGIENLRSVLERMADEVYSEDEIEAPLASSSRVPDAVVVAPCSQTMLAKIASGIGDTLASRLALNALRLRRRTVLVFRETPITAIDALNMMIASLAGAVVLPASPAFYHKPRDIQGIVDFVVGKVLDVLGIPHELYKRWDPQQH